MHRHSSDKHENKSQASANSLPKQLFDGGPSVDQDKLQQAINSSPRVQQLRAYQKMADGCLQARRLQGHNGPMSHSKEVVQRLAIGAVEEYDGYLNGDGMIRHPQNVGYFVGLLRAGLPLPNGEDPIKAAKNVEMVATPDDEAQYMNAGECEEDDDRERVTKNVLGGGHHRVAAYAEMHMPIPEVADDDTYAISGYQWNKLESAQYELKEEDIPVFPAANQQQQAAVLQAPVLDGQQQEEMPQAQAIVDQEEHLGAMHEHEEAPAVEAEPVLATQPLMYGCRTFAKGSLSNMQTMVSGGVISMRLLPRNMKMGFLRSHSMIAISGIGHLCHNSAPQNSKLPLDFLSLISSTKIS